MNANTEMYDSKVDRATMLRLYETRMHTKTDELIQRHSNAVQELIGNGKLTQAGKKSLKEELDNNSIKLKNNLFENSKRGLFELSSSQLSYNIQKLEAVLANIIRPQRPQKQILEDLVLKRPLYKDLALEDCWRGISYGDRQRIEFLIRKGLARGETLESIALEIRKQNPHKITRYQSRSLTTTAITSVTNQVDHAVYEKHKEVLIGWQSVAILDSSTTTLCASLDGVIFPIENTKDLPPRHINCRSFTTPVVKSWDELNKLESVAYLRKRNLSKLSKDHVLKLDGATPLRESYSSWLSRQPKEIQIKHLGDYSKVKLFQEGNLDLNQFVNSRGDSIGIRELKALTEDTFNTPGETRKFALAKQKLEAMQLGATTPDDFINDIKLRNTLRDYYRLQAIDLSGTLSLVNYRGTLLGSKKAMKTRVLTTLPREDQLIYNPLTRRYEDSRLYRPNLSVLKNSLDLVIKNDNLLDRDKFFIQTFDDSLSEYLGANERAVIVENLRIIFARARENKELWGNFKAVSQNQIKFDVMNISDNIETQLRKDTNVLKKLKDFNYLDPVLGPTSLKDLSDNFIDNIVAKNTFEDKEIPKIAKKLHSIFDLDIPFLIKSRCTGRDLQSFYLRFAHRLSISDLPDRDQFAVDLGRDLYNVANLNGSRIEWYNLGLKLLETKKASQLYTLETYGVQKRRMKSRMSGNYFGPYYDTISYNIKLINPELIEYAKITRKVETGLRVAVFDEKNRLSFKKGYKTYFAKGKLGLFDTRIPITSTSSFSDFPSEFLEKELVDALNWAASAKYKIDADFYDFINKLIYFEDDKGKAQYYNNLNSFKKYVISRGDTYERFKMMDYLVTENKAFSNHPFIDHRARIYERGFIGPQAGETFRPFLNASVEKAFGPEHFANLQDQIGAFLGGLSDLFESSYNGLTVTGRQQIANKWRPELIKLGNQMLRRKPADIRAILDNPLVAEVDPEEIAKFYRLAMESAKIDNFLKGDYSNLERLREYKTALAMEQDASSSGAQIIALTTKNKQLAELSNVIPTRQKRRLYDEIALATFDDPEFKKINEKLGLTEKDLRKAAKAQNMVTFYGAGERTGILNVEAKLSKVLNKQEGTLVITAQNRDTVLNEISARIAKYEKIDPLIVADLKALRNNVKDIFNKGLDFGDDILEALYFLESGTRDLVTKMTQNYNKVVTPDDFKAIANIMSKHLEEQVPILKDFTRFLGKLAEDFLKSAKPSQSAMDWKTLTEIQILGSKETSSNNLPALRNFLGMQKGETYLEFILKHFYTWDPNSTLSKILLGVPDSKNRRTGLKLFTFETLNIKDFGSIIERYRKTGKIEFLKENKLIDLKIGYSNKLPKRWTNIPWVNFDGKTIEQNFTQSFEEKLMYKDSEGNWITNILQVPQKTEASWWDGVLNKSGKINDIADVTKARTAFAVNGNHSNDATIVKQFHLWGSKNNIETSTVHDAFFTHIVDMLKGRDALRSIYSKTLDKNVILAILKEMKGRGLPKELFEAYLKEAIELGLIPVAGKSKIGGKIISEKDILKKKDILKPIKHDFKTDDYWYGVG